MKTSGYYLGGGDLATRKTKKVPRPAAARPSRTPPKAGPRRIEATTTPPARSSARVAARKPSARPEGPTAGDGASESSAASVRPEAAAPASRPAAGVQPRPSAANVRRPQGAEELKAKLAALTNATHQIKSLRRSVPKSFYEIGLTLAEIRDRRLFEVKGYGSFEAFVEREVDLGKKLVLQIAKVPQVFLREAAVGAGLDRVLAALAALEGEAEPPQESSSTSARGPTSGRSPIPFHKQ